MTEIGRSGPARSAPDERTRLVAETTATGEFHSRAFGGPRDCVQVETIHDVARAGDVSLPAEPVAVFPGHLAKRTCRNVWWALESADRIRLSAVRLQDLEAGLVQFRPISLQAGENRKIVGDLFTAEPRSVSPAGPLFLRSS